MTMTYARIAPQVRIVLMMTMSVVVAFVMIVTSTKKQRKEVTKMPKTVYGLIKEAQEDIEKSLSRAGNISDIASAYFKLQKAIDAIDNGGSLETVVRG